MEMLSSHVHVRSSRYLVLLGALIGCLSPLYVDAHTAGLSFEKDTDSYRVDIGYSPAFPVVGERLTLDFQLFESDETNPVNFSHVQIQVLLNGSILLSKVVEKKDFIPTTVHVVPNERGTITVSAEYMRENESLVEATFDLKTAGWAIVYFSKVLWYLGILSAIGMNAASIYIYYLHRTSMKQLHLRR